MSLALLVTSVALFSFGAACFLLLALFYLRQRPPGDRLFRLFALLCGLLFVANLAGMLLPEDPPGLSAILSILAASIPPLMLQLTLRSLQPSRGQFRFWRVWIPLLYLASLGTAVGRELELRTDLDSSSPVLLAAVSLSAIAAVLLNTKGGNQESRWTLLLFGTLLAASSASLLTDHPAAGIVPDYVVLGFLAVRLYYAERFAFFDVFLKAGAFFLAGLSSTAGDRPFPGVGARMADGPRLDAHLDGRSLDLQKAEPVGRSSGPRQALFPARR